MADKDSMLWLRDVVLAMDEMIESKKVPMADIININKPKNGDQTFMMCPCTSEGSMVAPVIIHDKSGPIIVSLVCTECEQSADVINGIVQLP